MAGLADTIADNAVYVVLAVVLFALFFLALNGAMPDDASGPDDSNATVLDDGDGPDGAATGNGSGDDVNGSATEGGDGAVNETDGAGPGNVSADGPAANETDAPDVDRIEALLIEGVDAERNASNASNVTNVSWIRSGALREMAAYHTEDMITHGYVAVESPGGEGLEDRRESFQPDCGGRALAELVGRAETVTDTGVRRNASMIASTLVQGWLDGRSDTLLRNDTALGAVAAGLDAEGSRVYVTMDLC